MACVSGTDTLSRVAAASARYDGHAEWYDDRFPPFDEDADCSAQLLSPGEGRACLDV